MPDSKRRRDENRELRAQNQQIIGMLQQLLMRMPVASAGQADPVPGYDPDFSLPHNRQKPIDQVNNLLSEGVTDICRY